MDTSSVSVNDLAKACAHSSEAEEWEEFLRRCVPLASLVALRVSRLWLNGSSPATVDDIVQEVFLKLCERERRILRDFVPRGEDSFLGLLRIVSASVANDYFRRMHSQKRGGKVVTTALVEDAAPLPSSGASQAAQMRRSVLLSELDGMLRSAPEAIGERDRSLFWLYYLQGLTAEEIARLPVAGLTAKGVESVLRRVTRWLREEIAGSGPVDRSESGQERQPFRKRNVTPISDT
jgi:RNA polymerase sigma factor (sigma-70 family)